MTNLNKLKVVVIGSSKVGKSGKSTLILTIIVITLHESISYLTFIYFIRFALQLVIYRVCGITEISGYLYNHSTNQENKSNIGYRLNLLPLDPKYSQHGSNYVSEILHYTLQLSCI